MPRAAHGVELMRHVEFNQHTVEIRRIIVQVELIGVGAIDVDALA